MRLIDFEEEAARRWYETGRHLKELWRKERAKAVQRALTRFKKTPSAQLQTMLHPQEGLIERLNDTSLPHQDRLLIGQMLAEFGDTRDGVGVKDDVPDIVWVDISGGSVELEEVTHVFKVNPFRIAKYPVTNEQFEAFLNAEDGYRNEEWWRDLERSEVPDKPSCWETNAPRETISWYEAVAFCRWLSARTETSIRLPTEWEWQQGATGGDPQREYPWEGEWDGSRCNSNESGLRRTTAVGVYPNGVTAQGVYDMAGNVWEWCLNGYEKPAQPEAVRIDQREYNQRVIRGGSWFNEPEALRASVRNGNDAFNRYYGIGFRLVQDIEP